MLRREALRGLAMLPALAGGAARAQQPYPNRPVRILVGVNAGGAADVLARIFAQKLGASMGQSFVVDNRPGAGGTLAADIAAKAPADGYTLLASTPTVMEVAPFLYQHLPFVPARDFEPVTLLGGGPLVLVVNAQLPVRSVADLVALARAKPGQVAFGSGGQGTASHLTAQMFASMAALQLLHSPYKGDGQALTDLLGGQVQMMFTALNLAAPYVQSGQLRLLAITSKTRLPSQPGLATMQELGFRDFESLGWIGIYAPAHTPPAIAQRLSAEWQKIRSAPEVASRFDLMGMGVLSFRTPQEFAAFQRSELARWTHVIQEAGIRPE